MQQKNKQGPNFQPFLILGGTFDPIHLGHVHVAREVLKKVDADEICIIPCNQSPHRAKAVASTKDRLAMAQLAAQEFSFLCVDDREIKRGGVSYMVDTLNSLHAEKNADIALCLIMGVDAFAEFTQWHKWRAIIKLAHLIVVNRPGYLLAPHEELKGLIDKHKSDDPDDLQRYPAGKILFLEIEPNPFSATLLRAHLRAGEEGIKDFLPKKVWEYIKQNSLYKSE